jgi:hypothetical protein
MSHTIRRRESHTRHERGNRRQVPVEGQHRHAGAVTPKPKHSAAANPLHDLVTDHAVLRWLERVTGIDVASQVRAEILADGRAALIQRIGFGKVRMHDGRVVLQIREGRVVTVKVREVDHGE